MNLVEDEAEEAEGDGKEEKTKKRSLGSRFPRLHGTYFRTEQRTHEALIYNNIIPKKNRHTCS